MAPIALPLEKPTDYELREEIRGRLKDITFIRRFSEIYEDEKWYVFGYIADLEDARLGPRNLYVYVPKQEGGRIQMRVHGFLPFPFPSVSYKEFRRFQNDPELLNELSFIFTQSEDSLLKRHFLNQMILDFALDEDFIDFFDKEKQNFYAFQEKYIDRLDQIASWNDKILKKLSTIPAQPNLSDMPAADDALKDYITFINDIGIDSVLPYVTESSCKRCFMMISSYSPSDNFSGFLWIEDESLLPPWDPNGIYFRIALGKGWYIFRST